MIKFIRWWHGWRFFGFALYIGSGVKHNPVVAFGRDRAGAVLFIGSAQFNFGGHS